MRPSLLAVTVALCCLAVLSMNQPSVGQAASAAPNRVTWEYKTVDLKSLVDLKGRRINVFNPDPKVEQEIKNDVEAALNRLGADGWELCLEVNGGLIFKRPA